MKTTALVSTLLLALSLAGVALACNGKNGECCDGDKKAPSADVTGADSALAEQAARSMLDSDQPRPNGTLTPEMRAKLASDSEAITKSIKAGKVNNTCHDADGAQCGSEGCKSCCGGKKDGVSVGAKAPGGDSNALDGRTVALRGKCPDHKN